MNYCYTIEHCCCFKYGNMKMKIEVLHYERLPVDGSRLSQHVGFFGSPSPNHVCHAQMNFFCNLKILGRLPSPFHVNPGEGVLSQLMNDRTFKPFLLLLVLLFL